MAIEAGPDRRRLQFTLRQIATLTAGIAIGLAAMKFWEHRHPHLPQVFIVARVFEVERDANSSPAIPTSAMLDERATGKLRDRIESLRAAGKATVLAATNVIAVSGCSTQVCSGGNLQIPILADDGAQHTFYRRYGTNIEFLPTVLENGRIRVKMGLEVCELDDELGHDLFPGLITRKSETEIECADGETILINGLKGISRVRNDCDLLYVVTFMRYVPSKGLPSPALLRSQGDKDAAVD